MQTVLLALLGIFIRQAILLVAGALGVSDQVKALADQYATEYQQLVAAVAMTVVVAGYAGWRYILTRQRLLTATQLAHVTERRVEAVTRSTLMPTPSVFTPKDEIPS